jgi:hypothetical protein
MVWHNTLCVLLFESIVHFVSHHFYRLDTIQVYRVFVALFLFIVYVVYLIGHDSGVLSILHHSVFLRSVLNNLFYTIHGRVLTCSIYIWLCVYVYNIGIQPNAYTCVLPVFIHAGYVMAVLCTFVQNESFHTRLARCS